MNKETLGDLELLVLLGILRCEGDAYGVTITRAIRERTGREVTRAGVYVTLRRLEQQGLLGSHMSDPLPERGGRARRYYRVLEPGMQLLRRTRRDYQSMWSNLGLEERTS